MHHRMRPSAARHLRSGDHRGFGVRHNGPGMALVRQGQETPATQKPPERCSGPSKPTSNRLRPGLYHSRAGDVKLNVLVHVMRDAPPRPRRGERECDTNAHSGPSCVRVGQDVTLPSSRNSTMPNASTPGRMPGSSSMRKCDIRSLAEPAGDACTAGCAEM